MSSGSQIKTRKLFNGIIVPEEEKPVVLISSKCPGKWIAIDLETLDIWERTPNRWIRASAETVRTIRDLAILFLQEWGDESKARHNAH